MATKLVDGHRIEMSPEEVDEFDVSRTISAEDALQAERASMGVTRFQARAALHQSGLLTAVQAIMEDPETDPVVVIAWQDAQVFRRHSPTIATIAQQMELTEEQVDDLFRLAATIEA